MMETLVTKEGKPVQPNERAYNPKTGKHVQITLDRAAKLWPTPTQDSATERTKKYAQGGKPLTLAVQEEEIKRWPTPRASAAMNENLETVKKRIDRKGKLRGKLEEEMAIEMFPTERWPTPTARDYKDSGKAVINSDRNLLPQKVAKKDKEQWIKGGGSLNPTWVEWLMGYPTGWTDLNA